MAVIKHRVVFNPHAHEASDFEEATPGEFVRRISPAGKPPRLLVVQPADSRGIAEAQHLLFAPLPAVGRQRVEVVEIGQRGFAGVGIALHADLTVRQHHFKIIPQKRQRQTARPVDIKMTGVATLFPMLNHITPPGIFQRGGHVVRHNIKDQTQPGRLQGADQPLKTGPASDGGVNLVSIGDVITVRRIPGGSKYWRSIQMADAELLQIRHQTGGTIKGHAVTKLNTPGRCGDHQVGSPCAKRTITVFASSSVRPSGQANNVSPAISGIVCG